eukprot:4190031-Pyramimonas_sp.AAC.1
MYREYKHRLGWRRMKEEKEKRKRKVEKRGRRINEGMRILEDGRSIFSATEPGEIPCAPD